MNLSDLEKRIIRLEQDLNTLRADTLRTFLKIDKGCEAIAGAVETLVRRRSQTPTNSKKY